MKRTAVVLIALFAFAVAIKAAEPVANIEQQIAQVQAELEAARKAAAEAQAKVGPLLEALRKADAAYAAARNEANKKRQKAEESKRLAGPEGAQELQRLKDNLAATIKQLEQAQQAIPQLEQAVAKARQEAAPLIKAFEEAEQAARQAEAAAQKAWQEAHKYELEAEAALARVSALRRKVQAAKAALNWAQQAERRAQNWVDQLAKRLADAQAQQKPAEVLAQIAEQRKQADAALANAKKQVALAQAALSEAEKQLAEAERIAEQKKQLADQVAAKRKAIEDARAALVQVQQAQQEAQKQLQEANAKVNEAQKEKSAADQELARAKKRVEELSKALEQAEKAAEETAARAEQLAADPNASPEQKEKAKQQATEKRNNVARLKSELAKAQRAEQQAASRAQAAAKKLTDAQAQKQQIEQQLANLAQQIAAAQQALKAAQEAAGEIARLDQLAEQAAQEAAAKRQAASKARSAMLPKSQVLENATMKLNSTKQQLAQAESRKNSLEKSIASLEKRIEAAKQSLEADLKAAQEAEAGLAPLQKAAQEARQAYLEARRNADEKQAIVRQLETKLYRLLAAQRIRSIMELPGKPKPINQIDRFVFAKLDKLGIEPALCTDGVFVRRVYLDILGRLPTAEEARSFILSKDPNKRAALVDKLLDSPEHAEYWAMKWADILRIKAEFPVKLWPNAAQAYHRWILESVAQNKPYDQFARELLTSSGSNFRVGPVNFYRAIQNRTPEGIAAAVGLAFLGSRVDFWPEEQRKNLEVFFSQVGYKLTSEWKEEIVFWNPYHLENIPGSFAPGQDSVDKVVAATNQIPTNLETPLEENKPIKAVLPDGTEVTIPPDRDPREVFADWLIRPDNPWFAKAIVNRTWAWIMGRGIIHEADDIRPDNPPSNPELLAYLEKELVSHNYDLRYLKRLIFTSATYQFSSIPRGKEPEASANFAYYPMRRIEAEVLADALNQITGTTELYTSAVPEPFTYIPKTMRAVAIADGSITSSFLTLFGRSPRATGMESERSNDMGSQQWLYMLNSVQVQRKLQSGPKLLALINSTKDERQIVEKLYLTILSRFPTEAEVETALQYAKSGVARGRDAWLDLAWALINNPEFLMRH